MESRSYTLEELPSHLENRDERDPSLLPVSPLRLQSYLHNPRALPTDRVLFEMREGKRLIAYRTLLPDHFYDESGNPRRFAWLSGNFVLPEYRRKGISTQLLQQAEARWEGQLMYTNYAPASKAVYDRTGQFRLLASREGARFYLRAASAELLRNRLGDSPGLRSADKLINLLVNFRLKRYTLLSDNHGITGVKGNAMDQFKVTRMEEMDRSMKTLIREYNGSSLFRRDAKVLKWILHFPWVTDAPVPDIPYHFSYRSAQFENILLKIEAVNGRDNGFLWLVVHGRRLSVPYLFTTNEKLFPMMARLCMDTIIRRDLAHVTVRHEGLRNELRLFRKWFLSIRSMPQLIFVHRSIHGTLPGTFALQDGDGDVVFTG